MKSIHLIKCKTIIILWAITLILISAALYTLYLPPQRTHTFEGLGSSCSICADVGRTVTQTITSNDYTPAKILILLSAVMYIITLQLTISNTKKRRHKSYAYLGSILLASIILSRILISNLTAVATSQVQYADSGYGSSGPYPVDISSTRTIIISILIALIVISIPGFAMTVRATRIKK